MKGATMCYRCLNCGRTISKTGPEDYRDEIPSGWVAMVDGDMPNGCRVGYYCDKCLDSLRDKQESELLKDQIRRSFEYACSTPIEDDADMVNHPPHYTSGDIECIDAIEASMTPEAFAGYLKGNVMKYLWRYRFKGNESQDLHKAQWYLNKLTGQVDKEQ